MSFSRINVMLHTALRNFRVLSLYKLWNIIIVTLSFYLSRYFNKTIHWGNPVILMIEPTNYCNLKCPLCPSGNGMMTRDKGMMPLELFKNLIDSTKRSLYLAMFWNQGEPFLNKSLLKQVSYAHENNVATVISTNGHYIGNPHDAKNIIDSGLSELIVSLDGASEESYLKYRVGGDFQRVLSAIKFLSSEKKKSGALNPIIHLQFILFKHNQHEIERIGKMAFELGADKYSFKTAQVYTDSDAEKFLPTDSDMNRYDVIDGVRTLKANWSAGCKRIWYTAMVNWDGSIAPCCYDKDIDYNLGDANTVKLSEVWDGDNFNQFRNTVLKERNSIEMCRNCTEGLKIKQFHKVVWVNG